MSTMSEITPGRVPALTLGGRLRLAMGTRRIGDMATELGLSRVTVSKWLNDHVVPARGHLIAWAVLTGVDLDWLITGRDSRQDSAA